MLSSHFRDTGSSKTFDTEMYPIIGACLPMQGRQLPSTKLSEDEESCDAHEELQEEDKWWMSDMQTIDSVVLLPRETLPRDQVSRSVLFQHQTQNKAATTATTITTGAITQVSKTTITSSLLGFHSLEFIVSVPIHV